MNWHAASNFATSIGIFAAYTQHLGLILLNKKPTGLDLCHLLLIWLFYNYNYFYKKNFIGLHLGYLQVVT